MIEPTRIRGLSEAKGSWKTICISRRSDRSCDRSAAMTSIVSASPLSSWRRRKT